MDLPIYSSPGEVSKLCGNEGFVFPMMKGQTVRDKAKYAANKKNAFMRWHATAYERIRTYTNYTKEKAKEKAKEKEKEKAKAYNKPHARLLPSKG